MTGPSDRMSDTNPRDTTTRWKWSSRVRSHPVLVAFLLYAFLAVVYFWQGLLPGHTTSASDYLWSVAPWNTRVPSGLFVWSRHPLEVGSNTQLVDAITVFEPFLQYARSFLPHVPLWDPYIMGGTPFLADMQSAIFSPFSIPAYILPFWWSLSFIAVMKVVVSCLGAFLLARSLNMRFAGAFLCGVVFGFGLFMIAWLPWPLANVFAFIPWMMFATERIVRRPGPWSVAGLAVIVALQFFGGHPESSFQALFAVGCFFVLRVLQGKEGVVRSMREAAGRARPTKSRAVQSLKALFSSGRRPLIAFVIAIALGTALAAVAIVPFLELLKNSSDLSSRPRGIVYVQPKFFFASLLPTYYNGVQGSFLIEDAFYAGVLPVMLAVFALLKPKVERVAIGLFGVFCVLIVLGIQPLFGIVGKLPGFDFTYLSRLTILYLLCIALLAGWGLDDLMTRPVRDRARRMATAIPVTILLLPVVVVLATRSTSVRFLGRAIAIAWAFAQRPLPGAANLGPIVRLSALLIFLTIALFATLILVLRLNRKLSAATFAALAILLVVGDLFQAGMGENPAIPDSHAIQPVTPAIRYLQSQEPNRYVAVSPYIGFNPLPPDVNVRYGLYDARGYDLPVITRFSNVWSTYVAPATPLLPLDTPAVPILNLELEPAALRVLSLMGVRDILEEKGDTPLRMAGLHVVYDGYDATIYQNDDAMPRTWLVDQQAVLPEAKSQLHAFASAAFDARHVLITGSKIPGLSIVSASSHATTTAGATSLGSSRITDYQAQKVTVDVNAERASELVLSDTYYPGWKVTVNGRPASISEVDYLFRGVAVPAGSDKVIFTYDPQSFKTGWEISLVATLILLGGIAFEYTRRRRRARSDDSQGQPRGRPRKASNNHVSHRAPRRARHAGYGALDPPADDLPEPTTHSGTASGSDECKSDPVVQRVKV